MRYRGLAPTLALAAVAVLTTTVPADATSAIRFTKAYYNSPGSDSGSNTSLNAEWVRVKNFGAKPRTLTGWTIRDASGHVYKFPAFTLPAGGSVTLHSGSGTNTASNLYWDYGSYVWNNGGDRAILKNKAGTTLDTCRWSGGGSWVLC